MLEIFIGAVVVVITTLTSNFYLKARQTKITARDSAYQICIVLALQRSSLANISVFVEHIKNSKAHSKFVPSPSVLPFKDEMIYKVLAYSAFIRHSNATRSLQRVMIAQAL